MQERDGSGMRCRDANGDPSQGVPLPQRGAGQRHTCLDDDECHIPRPGRSAGAGFDQPCEPLPRHDTQPREY